MTDTNTQAVVEDTNAAPVATAAEPLAREDNLDAILNEFENATKPTQPEQKPAAASPDVANEINALKRSVQEMKFKEEFTPVLKKIRGDIPESSFTDEEITDWLDGKARRDPRLRDAFLNKATNPAAWSKAEKFFQQELAKKFSGGIDQAATETREAVTAAVRSASTKAPPEKPPKYGELTNGEYRQKIKSEYGFDPGV